MNYSSMKNRSRMSWTGGAWSSCMSDLYNIALMLYTYIISYIRVYISVYVFHVGHLHE